MRAPGTPTAPDRGLMPRWLSGGARRASILLAAAVALAVVIGLGLRIAPKAPSPDLTFTDGDGRATTMADFRGRVVLLNLWATWCVPCRQEISSLDRVQARLGGPDFQVIALSVDRAGAPVVRRFYDEIGVRRLSMFLDTTGNAVRQLNAPGLPTTLLLDRAGREIGRFVGSAEWDTPAIVETIEKALDRR